MPHAEFYQGTGDQKLSREAGEARQLHGLPRARISFFFKQPVSIIQLFPRAFFKSKTPLNF